MAELTTIKIEVPTSMADSFTLFLSMVQQLSMDPKHPMVFGSLMYAATSGDGAPVGTAVAVAPGGMQDYANSAIVLGGLSGLTAKLMANDLSEMRAAGAPAQAGADYLRLVSMSADHMKKTDLASSVEDVLSGKVKMPPNPLDPPAGG